MLSLVLIATIGAWIGFDNPLFHLPPLVLALPLGLAWIGLRATSLKDSFKYGWLGGTLAATGCLYWVIIPVQYYGGLPWYIAFPCPLLLGGAMGVYYALFASALHLTGRQLNSWALCLLAGIYWAAMELLMSFVLSGFPWLNLSSAFANWPLFIQGASFVGAYGLSGLMAAFAVAVLLFKTYRGAQIMSIVLCAGLIGFGFFRLQTFEEPIPDFEVAIVQGNIDQSMKWEPALQEKTVNTYLHFSNKVAKADAPRVILWPETAMPFYLQDNTVFRKVITDFTHDTKTSVISGSPAYKVIDLKTRKYVLLNRAWLVDDTGRILQSYDKEHLVPFGEYMPLEKWVPFKKLVQATGNFVAGSDNKPLLIDGVALGMFICYEGIFPELAQQQVAKGANVLLNISNDAWFGDSSAPRQHLALTTMRAVEQGRWLVRGTNSGISAFIDPLGRIVKISRQFKAETLSAAVSPLRRTTYFHQNYETINRMSLILSALGLIWVIFADYKSVNRKPL